MSDYDNQQDSREMVQLLRGIAGSLGSLGNPMGGIAGMGYDGTSMQQSMRYQRSRENSAFLDQASSMDNRADWAMRTMARSFAPNNQAQWIQDHNSWRPWASTVANLLPASVTGGSQLSLATGIQSMVAASGFQTNRGAIFGGEAGTNALSLSLMRGIQNDFYDKNGFAKLNMTQGFNRNELGAIMQQVGQQGGLAGLHIGDIGMQDGKQVVKIDDSTRQQITSRFKEITTSLRNLKDIVGDKSVAEMMEIGKSLTGVQVGTLGGAQLLRSRLNRLGAAADASGMDPQAVIQATARNAARMTDQYGAIRAADIANDVSVGTARDLAIARAQASKAGLPPPDEVSIMADQQNLHDIFNKEGGEGDQLIAARARLSHGGTSTQMDAARRVLAAANQPSTQERDAQMRADYALSDSANLVAALGGTAEVLNQMSPQERQSLEASQRRMFDADTIKSAQNTIVANSARILSGTSNEFLRSSVEGLGDYDTMRALGSGDKDAVGKLDATQRKAWDRMVKERGEAGAREAAKTFADTALGNHRSQFLLTAAQREEQALRETASFVVRADIGSPNDLVGSFGRGLVSSEPQTPEGLAKQMIGLSVLKATANGGTNDSRVTGGFRLDTDKDVREFLAAQGKGKDEIDAIMNNGANFKNGRLTGKGLQALQEGHHLDNFQTETISEAHNTIGVQDLLKGPMDKAALDEFFSKGVGSSMFDKDGNSIDKNVAFKTKAELQKALADPRTRDAAQAQLTSMGAELDSMADNSSRVAASNDKIDQYSKLSPLLSRLQAAGSDKRLAELGGLGGKDINALLTTVTKDPEGKDAAALQDTIGTDEDVERITKGVSKLATTGNLKSIQGGIESYTQGMSQEQSYDVYKGALDDVNKEMKGSTGEHRKDLEANKEWLETKTQSPMGDFIGVLKVVGGDQYLSVSKGSGPNSGNIPTKGQK